MKQYIYGHNSLENAYLGEDYPWGFTQLTKMRYWIETREDKGQRFVSQSMNPQTGLWCKPKKSTYVPIAIMYLDELNHIRWTYLPIYANEEQMKEFTETHLVNLDEFQKEQLKWSIAHKKVMQKVKVTCEIVSCGEKPREERQKEQEQSFKNIQRAISFEMNKIPF